jgi:hypothetical protein
MRLRVLPLLLLAAALLVPASLVRAVGATDPTAPGVDQWVDGALDLAQPTVNEVDITGTLHIHKYPVQQPGDGTQVYSALDMANAYNGANRFGANVGAAFLADAQAAVSKGFSDSLNASFPKSEFPSVQVTVTQADIDATSLQNAGQGADEFHAPVDVAVAAKVLRSNADLGLGTLTTDGLGAAFAAGATVSTSVNLSSSAGWTTTFTLHVPAAPSGLVFAAATAGTRSADHTSVTMLIDNAAVAPADATPRELDLTLADGGATAPTHEDIAQTVDITLGAPVANVTTLPIAVDAQAAIHAVSVATRFPGALPAKASLDYVSADGIRALHATGVLTDAQLQKANDDLLKEVKDHLATAFGGSPTVTGGFDASTLPATAPAKPYKSDPPVGFDAKATTSYQIPGSHAGDLDLALDIGATVKFNVTLFSGAQDEAFTLHAPAGAVFTKADGGQLASDGKTATFTVPAKATDVTRALAMRSATAPAYTAEDAKLGVTIDLKDLQVSLGGVTKGDFGNLVVDVAVDGDLGVVSVDKLPDATRAQLLGPNLELAYISGNAIRLAEQRGLVSAADLRTIESDLLNKTSENLASSMGGAVKVAGGFTPDSLSPAASATTPIVFAAHASFVKPLAGGAPVDTTAVALYTVKQSFDLPRVQGLDTAYTIILPRGLALASLSAPGATTTTGTSSDGRDQFTVTPGSGGATTASVGIAVTPTFVFLKFWPLVLAAVLLLVLIIGTPIAIVVVRRGRRNKAAGKK